MRRQPIIVLTVCLLAASPGCSALRTIFGSDGGYLFEGYDCLAVPGREVEVKVRLLSGSLLRDRTDVPVRFKQAGRPLGEIRTDGEGFATVPFTPPAPGDYVVSAEVPPEGLKTGPPAPTEVLVACRAPAVPIVIVDLDKTLVASGFKTVLVGDPPPMPHSTEVMRRLARDFTVVYLSHRLDYFGPKSKAWLRRHVYPRGPVLLAGVRDFFKGSGEFKTEVLEQLRRLFKGRMIGIGDQVSDALAYRANGLEAFLIPPVEEPDNPDSLRDLARELEPLPDDVQVVTGWNEIAKAIYDGWCYPRSAFQDNLLSRAERLEQTERTGKNP